MNELLEKVIKECARYTQEGKIADYIPELAKANKDDMGIYIISGDNRISCAGNYTKLFSIQSIIKP